MEELEQNLENLDELRKQAKDYASTIVLPNDERLNIENQQSIEDRQAELLQKRDEQEAKLNEEIKAAEKLKEETIYIPSNERYDNQNEQIQEHDDRINELLQKRDEQEARWKMQSDKSLIGKISKKVAKKLNGNQERKQELLNSNFLEEVASATERADLKLAEFSEPIIEPQNVVLDQDKLLGNIPTSTLEHIKDDELLFSMEKEEIKMKTLKVNKQGSVFSSILIILTTLTVGIIAAAIMLLK